MYIDKLIDNLRTNFPKCVIDIKESTELLKSCLEDAVDSIEDKAYKVIKKDRDYEKGDSYRELSKQLYDIAVKLQEYVEKLDYDEVKEQGIDEEMDDDKDLEEEVLNQTPDYSHYSVDTNVEHTLYEDFSYKKPYAFSLKGTKVLVNDWRGLFLNTADILAAKNEDIISSFPDNPEMNGKKLVYFSFHKNSKMTSPRKLKNIDIYVTTQLSSNTIRNIIINMLRQYGIPISEYKIFLAADYSEKY